MPSLGRSFNAYPKTPRPSYKTKDLRGLRWRRPYGSALMKRTISFYPRCMPNVGDLVRSTTGGVDGSDTRAVPACYLAPPAADPPSMALRSFGSGQGSLRPGPEEERTAHSPSSRSSLPGRPAYDRLGRREEADVGEAREVMDRITD